MDTYDDDDILTVSDVNNRIKDVIGEIFAQTIIVQGEISNVKITQQGLFLTLKDGLSSINTICWGYKKDPNEQPLNNGDEVLITGKITVYNKNGTYNMQIKKIEHIGTGDIYTELDRIKQEYEDKGYYKNKRPLLAEINSIGIATATTGAALQDIISTLTKNNFTGKIIVKNCIVQGQQSPSSIASAIKYLSNYKIKHKSLDVIIVGRGGGSLEDLFSFSDPKVLESIYQCRQNICVISAVGHETDTMLSDYVADIRATTPTAAAHIISANSRTNNLTKQIDKCIDQLQLLKNQIRNILNDTNTKIVACETKFNNYNKIIDYKLNELKLIESMSKNMLHNNINKIESVYNKIINLINDKQPEKIVIYNSSNIPITKLSDIIDNLKKKLIFRIDDKFVEITYKITKNNINAS